MGANRREHDGIELGVKDGSAARQCIGGRTGGCRHDDTVATMCVYVTAVDPSLEVQHAPRTPFHQYDVIEGMTFPIGLRRANDPRLQHRTTVAHVLTLENLVQTLAKVGRSDIGEKAEPPTVDAEHRDTMRRSEAGSMQHRAVPAHRDDQVDASTQVAFRNPCNVHIELDGGGGIDAHLARPELQMARERTHRIDDASVAIITDQRDTFE